MVWGSGLGASGFGICGSQFRKRAGVVYGLGWGCGATEGLSLGSKLSVSWDWAALFSALCPLCPFALALSVLAELWA